MRKLLTVVAASLAAAMSLTACGGTDASSDGSSKAASNDGGADAQGGATEVVVGASPVPHAKILEYVRDNLAKDAGITITIKEFDDYVLPNQTLDSGELDANYFQHLPYLEAEIANKGYEFEHGEGVHIEPMRVFAREVKSVDEVPEGAKVAITNDVSNQARALLLLQEGSLLKDITLESSVLDLKPEQNPKGLKFEELQPEVVVQMVDDPGIDLAIVNANFVLTAGLDASKAVLSEKVENNPYANVVAWRKDNKNEGVQKLDELLHSDKVKEFIKSEWPSGDVIPG